MIEEPPVLTVRRNFPRPPADQVKALEGTPTGFAVDAMAGRGALDHRIKPLVGDDPDWSRICGVALTCNNGPDDNLALVAALDLVQPGDVILAATDGFVGSAVTGDLVAGMAKNRGAVAIVTDGVVRDIDGLLQVGLPIFSRGVNPNSPVSNGPGSVGLPITIGGVAVSSGDVVVGDRDGVVIVPQARLDEVIERVAQVRVAEADLDAKVKGGLEVPDRIRDLLASDKVRYVD